ncbi:viral A-type inclusion protein [Planoprotostelium fungivorum]|uniref:Viral A-type inclusion protein n=1 Tax=Planoprotostelium fungivorum TaxID=1890364 RepID=A0A2P6NWA9_9EUKA|nr:viral A-type inclusion protein [Planoprotostelium fungivorum]
MDASGLSRIVSFDSIVRVKLFSDADRSRSIASVGQSEISIRDPRRGNTERKYPFATTFGSEASNDDVFQSLNEGICRWLKDGYNVNLITVGYSGTGKTHTLYGTSSEAGLIHQLIKYIMQSLDESNYRFGLSCWDVGREEAYDLLTTDEEHNPFPLSISEDASTVEIQSPSGFEHMMSLVKKRSPNWKEDGLRPNIFHNFLRLVIYKRSDGSVSTLHAIDLIGLTTKGSEASTYKNLSRDNKWISQDVLCLTRIITDMSTREPTRGHSTGDSRMADYLGPIMQCGKNWMVGCISPMDVDHTDTTSTLRLLSRCAAARSRCDILSGIPSDRIHFASFYDKMDDKAKEERARDEKTEGERESMIQPIDPNQTRHISFMGDDRFLFYDREQSESMGGSDEYHEDDFIDAGVEEIEAELNTFLTNREERRNNSMRSDSYPSQGDEAEEVEEKRRRVKDKEDHRSIEPSQRARKSIKELFNRQSASPSMDSQLDSQRKPPRREELTSMLDQLRREVAVELGQSMLNESHQMTTSAINRTFRSSTHDHIGSIVGDPHFSRKVLETEIDLLKRNYQTALNVIKEEENTKAAYEEVIEEVKLEMEELRLEHEVKAEMMTLRNKLKRLEEGSNYSDVFSLYEMEQERLQAEIMHLRNDNQKLEEKLETAQNEDMPQERGNRKNPSGTLLNSLKKSLQEAKAEIRELQLERENFKKQERVALMQQRTLESISKKTAQWTKTIEMKEKQIEEERKSHAETMQEMVQMRQEYLELKHDNTVLSKEVAEQNVDLDDLIQQFLQLKETKYKQGKNKAKVRVNEISHISNEPRLTTMLTKLRNELQKVEEDQFVTKSREKQLLDMLAELTQKNDPIAQQVHKYQEKITEQVEKMARPKFRSEYGREGDTKTNHVPMDKP